MEFNEYFKPSPTLDSIRLSAKDNLYQYIYAIIKEQRAVGESTWFQRDVDHLLNFKIGKNEIEGLLEQISPFESKLVYAMEVRSSSHTICAILFLPISTTGYAPLGDNLISCCI